MSLFQRKKLKEELTEKRPLPIGVTEFHEWADRIIDGALLPADRDSQKFALANDLLHCSPNTAFETDIYFIHRLRKYAVNQVADAMRTELRDKKKAELAAKEAAEQNQAEVTAPTKADAEILQDKAVQ